MLTRTQTYAAKAFGHVGTVAQDHCDKYKAMAEKLPTLIRTAGLAQALAFVEAKAGSEAAWGKLLDHLAETLGYNGRAALSAASRTLSLGAYMNLTNRALDALLWYKRFAQSAPEVTTAPATPAIPAVGGNER